MFAVIFEVEPKTERWDDYLAIAGGLRPVLEAQDGFLENIRYASRRRPGWLLSLSLWRDEKALIRWRTVEVHHRAQERGRSEIFRDYRLRVGEVSADSGAAAGAAPAGQRFDPTETGPAKLVSLTTMRRPAALREGAPLAEETAAFAVDRGAAGLVDWDLFEAILTPGDLLLLAAWRDAEAAKAAEAPVPAQARRRQVRIIRDYGLRERREAPQFYPAVGRPEGCGG